MHVHHVAGLALDFSGPCRKLPMVACGQRLASNSNGNSALVILHLPYQRCDTRGLRRRAVAVKAQRKDDTLPYPSWPGLEYLQRRYRSGSLALLKSILAAPSNHLPAVVHEYALQGLTPNLETLDIIATRLQLDVDTLTVDNICGIVCALHSLDYSLERSALDQIITSTYPRLATEPCSRLHMLLLTLEKQGYQVAIDWYRKCVLRIQTSLQLLSVSELLELGSAMFDIHLRSTVGPWAACSKAAQDEREEEHRRWLHEWQSAFYSAMLASAHQLDPLQLTAMLKCRRPWNYFLPERVWQKLVQAVDRKASSFSASEQVWMLSQIASLTDRENEDRLWKQALELQSSNLWRVVHQQASSLGADDLHELLVGTYYELSQRPSEELLKLFFWKSSCTVQNQSTDWIGWTAKLVREYSNVYIDGVWLEEFLQIICNRAGHMARGLEQDYQGDGLAVTSDVVIDACAYESVCEMCDTLCDCWTGWSEGGYDKYRSWLKEFNRW